MTKKISKEVAVKAIQPKEEASLTAKPEKELDLVAPEILPEAEIADLKKALEDKSKRAEDYLTKLQYLQAEYENYKKWVEKDKLEGTKFANERLISNLLNILDNLEAAISTLKKSQEESQFVSGFEMIYKELLLLLEKEGLTPIKAVGEKFDPYKHEVVMIIANQNEPDGIVIEELQKGYMLGSKVIRTAKVKVSKCEDIKTGG